MNPGLSISGKGIPLARDSFKFLEMSVRVYSNTTVAKVSVKECLKKMLVAVNHKTLTRQQKLRLFKQGIWWKISQSRGWREICNL